MVTTAAQEAFYRAQLTELRRRSASPSVAPYRQLRQRLDRAVAATLAELAVNDAEGEQVSA